MCSLLQNTAAISDAHIKSVQFDVLAIKSQIYVDIASTNFIVILINACISRIDVYRLFLTIIHDRRQSPPLYHLSIVFWAQKPPAHRFPVLEHRGPEKQCRWTPLLSLATDP